MIDTLRAMLHLQLELDSIVFEMQDLKTSIDDSISS